MLYKSNLDSKTRKTNKQTNKKQIKKWLTTKQKRQKTQIKQMNKK